MDSKLGVTGIFYALTAYTLWGLAPLYFKQVPSLSASEIVLYRVLFTSVVTAALVLLARQQTAVRRVLASPRQLLYLTASALVIGLNWLVFIWAVVNEQMLQASLGYFINPLVNVVFGVALFAERLRKLQWLAVGLATVIVGWQIAVFGHIPWIALSLAVSFAIYGAIRKQLSLPAIASLFLESVVLLPLALLYWLYLWQGQLLSPLAGLDERLLVFGLGVVTAAPLLFFTGAAARVRLITLGFFQYIGPTIVFLTAIWLYNEQVTPGEWWSFAGVWLALIVYSYDSWRAYRAQKRYATSVH